MDLPYFDPIRHVGIDIMQNLLLGLSKKMVTIWTSSFTVGGRTLSPMITPAHLKEMKEILENKFLLPPTHAVSSIARKIAIGDGFSRWYQHASCAYVSPLVTKLAGAMHTLKVGTLERPHCSMKSCTSDAAAGRLMVFGGGAADIQPSFIATALYPPARTTACTISM